MTPPMTHHSEPAREAVLDHDRAPTWPPLKHALWMVVTGEKLNDGHYINAYQLTDKLYDAMLSTSPAPAAGGLEAKTLRGIIARWETRREYLNTNPSAYDAFIAREVAGIAEPALASPAATIAETQGDGVRMREACIAAVRAALAATNLDGFKDIYKDGVIDGFDLAIAALAALAPSTSAATRGERECEECSGTGHTGIDGDEVYDCPVCLGEGVEPAPAVESAQVKEALRPFVDALDGADDDKAGDGAHIWEAPVAMNITYGDLRRAAKAFASLDLATDAEG